MRGLLPFLLLVACSKGAEADLAAIGEARSITAEWALVNEQAAKGQLTTTYTRTMRKRLREQLQAAQSTLTQPQSSHGVEIRRILEQPDDAPSRAFRSHAAALKQIEDRLESA